MTVSVCITGSSCSSLPVMLTLSILSCSAISVCLSHFSLHTSPPSSVSLKTIHRNAHVLVKLLTRNSLLKMNCLLDVPLLIVSFPVLSSSFPESFLFSCPFVLSSIRHTNLLVLAVVPHSHLTVLSLQSSSSLPLQLPSLSIAPRASVFSHCFFACVSYCPFKKGQIQSLPYSHFSHSRF